MICSLCNINKANQKHHLFSQTKVNRKLYGKLIDHPLNVMHICNDCHLNKSIPKMTELEFCEILGIEPRSKTEKIKRSMQIIVAADEILDEV